MMDVSGHITLAMIGVSHREAQVALREKVRLTPQRFATMVADLRAAGHLGGAVLLTTCNRVEIYFTAEDPARATTAFFVALTNDLTPLEAASIAPYKREGEDALLHLFRVAASLDSLVLGDTEILAQVRRAYETALESGLTDKALNLAFQWALKTGKGVRTHTSIQQRAASVASLVATELRDVVSRGPLVVLGAGEIAQSVLRNLRKLNPQVVVLNRSEESLRALAQDHRFTAGRLNDFIEHVGSASALVSCLGVETQILDAATLAAATWGRLKPLRIYDLGVPRNIDPQARLLPGVDLKDMDDLQAIVEVNVAGRAEAAAEAEEWIAGQVEAFCVMWALQPLAPILELVRGRKTAPPSELPALLEPHMAGLSAAALLELGRQLGPATDGLPRHLQTALTISA